MRIVKQLTAFLPLFLSAAYNSRLEGVKFQRHSFYAFACVLSLILSNNSFAETANTRESSPPQASVYNPPLTADDNEILAAKKAFDRRDLKALDAARAKFAASRHPLAPYVTYWRLSSNLASSSTFAVAQSDEIQSFLAANTDTPIADNLRRDWLKILGNLGQWSLFTSAYPQLVADDTELTCHVWRYRLIQNTANDRDTVAEVKALWNMGKTAPDACYGVFQMINSTNALSSDDVWRRVRLLLENNLVNDARRSAGFLKTLPGNFERTTAAINLDAGRYLAHEKPDAKSRASVELYLYAVIRLARNDAARAAEFLGKQAAQLSASDRAYAWAEVGLYGGMQHEPDTLNWFQRAEGARLNDAQAAWKTRAALRAGDWLQVRETIQAMSPSEKRESQWRYWLARAHEKSPTEGSTELSKSLKEALARENNFYALLAAEELGKPVRPNWQGYKPTAVELEAINARAGIQRVLALYRLDLKTEGFREWQMATRHFNDHELLAASEIARRNNIPDRAISAADRTLALHDYSQRFPMPFRDTLQISARNNQLDEAWVYGLIRQESRFMTDAKSPVGAMGLMQLMPATASWVAKQVGMKDFSSSRALDVPVNLNLGTFYLQHVLADLGHPVLATAAYNAGPGRARRWRAETPLEGAIYAETIPFTETRDYVKKVMANKWYYRNRLGATPITLAGLMGMVPGRNSPRSARLGGANANTQAAAVAKADAIEALPDAPADTIAPSSAPTPAASIPTVKTTQPAPDESPK